MKKNYTTVVRSSVFVWAKYFSAQLHLGVLTFAIWLVAGTSFLVPVFGNSPIEVIANAIAVEDVSLLPSESSCFPVSNNLEFEAGMTILLDGICLIIEDGNLQLVSSNTTFVPLNSASFSQLEIFKKT